MNALTSTWRQLVRRRLWPVAVLLVAALAAVPVLLAREPEAPAPIEPLAVSVEADDTITEPVVAELTPEDRATRRRVLGVRKDPFRPALVKKAKAAQEEPKEDAPSSSAPKPSPSPDSGGSAGGGAPSSGGEPAPAPKTYSPGTIIVRFGEASSSGQLTRFAVEKFEALPDDEVPLLVYMGLTKNGNKAKFMIDAAVEADGDGTCKPHPSSCEVIELAVGETEFLDVINPDTDEPSEEEGEEDEPEVVAQFQLDLVDIKRAGDADVK